jgi:hypothetical protein
MDPTGIVTFRQGDVGEYLREVWVSISDEMLLLTLCARRTLFSLPSFPVGAHGVLEIGFGVSKIPLVESEIASTSILPVTSLRHS